MGSNHFFDDFQKFGFFSMHMGPQILLRKHGAPGVNFWSSGALPMGPGALGWTWGALGGPGDFLYHVPRSKITIFKKSIEK